MSRLRRRSLPYHDDISTYIGWLGNASSICILDSGKPQSERGRYSIISAEPERVITLKPSSYGTFEESLLAAERDIALAMGRLESDDSLPFCGGAIGYLSYDYGEAIHLGRPPSSPLPLARVGVFGWAIVVDHHTAQTHLVLQPDCSSHIAHRMFAGLFDDSAPLAPFHLKGDFSSQLGPEQYRAAFAKVQSYIQAGDCYQINLARDFQASYSGSPLSAYLRLRSVAAAPFSAYWDFGPAQLLSFSPERLLSIDSERRLQTQPIKGTAPRHTDPKADQDAAQALKQSAKNRAENIMIVDLLRNDLGRSCTPGSVYTEKLLELQSFRTVHHLVSTVNGQMREDVGPIRALFNCFPGGSITGAPKRRAMEIIAELEPARRSLYCGSVFYISAGGTVDSSITIRSFVCQDGTIRGWAGGGIVADSNVDEELREIDEKIGALLSRLRDAE